MICPDTPQRTCHEHDTLWHFTLPDMSRSDLRFAKCRGIPRSCKFNEIVHFTVCHSKISSAVQLFDLIRSKICSSHSTSYVQKVSSAVRPHLLKTNVPQPFNLNCSIFSLAVQPFDLIRSQIFLSCLVVQCIRFERFVDPFLIHSIVVHWAVLTDTLRNVFAWEVSNFCGATISQWFHNRNILWTCGHNHN